jgi:hypothetical protein
MLQRRVIYTRAPSIFMMAAVPPAEAAPASEPAPSAVRATERPPAAEPAPSSGPPTPPQSPISTPQSPYDDLFNHATEAYLGRDYAAAITLYEQCLAERPDDGRVQNNLKRLRERVRG